MAVKSAKKLFEDLLHEDKILLIAGPTNDSYSEVQILATQVELCVEVIKAQRSDITLLKRRLTEIEDKIIVDFQRNPDKNPDDHVVEVYKVEETGPVSISREGLKKLEEIERKYNELARHPHARELERLDRLKTYHDSIMKDLRELTLLVTDEPEAPYVNVSQVELLRKNVKDQETALLILKGEV